MSFAVEQFPPLPSSRIFAIYFYPVDVEVRVDGLKDFAAMRKRAVEDLVAEGILRDVNVIAAMGRVPREEFLPSESKPYAYADTPIPIGFGQTTSALHMTAMFCEHSEMKLCQHVLEVGGGCGYMSCVYAEVVAPTPQPKERWGHVWSVEIVDGLAEYGRGNVERLGYSNRVTFIHADASEGLPREGPFDVIIVTSAAPEVPSALVDQLKPEGTLLIPVGVVYLYQDLLRIRRTRAGKLLHESLGGVAFVPMKGKHGWK